MNSGTFLAIVIVTWLSASTVARYTESQERIALSQAGLEQCAVGNTKPIWVKDCTQYKGK